MARPGSPDAGNARPGASDGFARRILAWYHEHGRKGLPWQHPASPYRVWVSEVMLQQTRVQAVITCFERFMAALPSLPALAAADEDRVLALWSGLGYYNRARNLHRAARICMVEHGGELPADPARLAALPGIGRSTAAAILALAHGAPHAILDGNVKRVLARFHGIRGWPGEAAIERLLWQQAEGHVPARDAAAYTQGIMDLGATVCTPRRPDCARCPLADDCIAHREGLTAELPAPRPRRHLPSRSTLLLLLHDASGRVLLERRPPAGVWAALWSLPEATDRASATDWLQRHDLQLADDAEPLAPFVHVFSHFRLLATPLRASVLSAPASVGEGSRLRWLDKDGLAHVGIPAPIRKLLELQIAMR